MRLLALWCLLFCLAHPARAQDPAPGIHVREARSWLVDDVYQLRARIDYVLSTPVSDALTNGLPLIIELQVQVVRDYFGIWDQPVASLTQQYQLQYHALSRQYLLRNLNSTAQRSYPTEQAALDALGDIDALPMLDRHLLADGVHYDGKVRARLDIESLPTPLRLVAYFDADWRLVSEWYRWPVQH
jgi:hypothetical protein